MVAIARPAFIIFSGLQPHVVLRYLTRLPKGSLAIRVLMSLSCTIFTLVSVHSTHMKQCHSSLRLNLDVVSDPLITWRFLVSGRSVLRVRQRGTVCSRIFTVLTILPPSNVILKLNCLHSLSSLNCFFFLFYFHCCAMSAGLICKATLKPHSHCAQYCAVLRSTALKTTTMADDNT